MNIKGELLKEHSRRQADKIALFACQNKEHFKELMQCFSSKEKQIAQRAAWSLSIASRKCPDLIEPYLNELTEMLFRKEVHPALIRNSLQILESMDIPEKLQGKVMHACFQFLESYTTPGAIKAYSLTTLYNLSKIYPEIRQELKVIIEDRWEHETPAFKSRGRKILKEIQGKTGISVN